MIYTSGMKTRNIFTFKTRRGKKHLAIKPLHTQYELICTEYTLESSNNIVLLNLQNERTKIYFHVTTNNNANKQQQ